MLKCSTGNTFKKPATCLVLYINEKTLLKWKGLIIKMKG